MITYIDENKNGSEYNVLFKKASAKLGLLPVEKEVGLDADGKSIIEYHKYVEGPDGQWNLVPCTPYDDTEGADNSNADFDDKGNFLIKKFVRHDEQTDEDIYEKVISNGITSLNEYFQHIEELSELAIGDGRSGSDPYFLRLPLDEPFFEINANTRGITVPGELSQIGVVGDRLAEILFFKIDRYYDAVDLDTRHIYIEWEAPDGQGGVRKGISRDFLRDTQSEKDKIIFGWLIDDVLTAYIGTIRFAVRFVEWTDREDEAGANAKLLYSFSSLPATISVSDTLHYTLFEDDEELQYNTDQYETAISNMKAAFENASPDAADETAPKPALAPEFVLNLGEDIGADEITENVLYTRNLIGGAKDEPHGSLRLEVEAYSPEGGSISYMFGYKSQNSSEIGTEAMPTKHDFKKVDDHSDTHRIYYIKETNDVYTPVSQTDIERLDGVDLYEKIAWAVAEHPGYYKASARNRVSGRKTTAADSYMLYIPYAAVPTVKTQIAEKFVISEVEYTKEHNDNEQSGRYATSNITYVASNAAAAAIPLKPNVTAADAIGDDQKANLSYQWFKNADIFDADISHATMIEGETAETLNASEPGYYAVKINNHFNNDDAETELADAGICRVTNMPQIPTIEWKNGEQNLWSDDVTLRAETTIPNLKVALGECDTFRYEWHQITEDIEDWDPIAEGMVDASGEIEVNSMSSEQEIPFKPNAFGFYYLILDVELNGAHVYLNTAEMQEYGIVYVTALQGN